MSCHVWKIPRHRGTRLRFFKKHALVTCFWQRHKIHLLVGRHSLSYLLHWRQISFCTIFLLTENAGLFKRQEGRGLFPESGWSHAVMQVTGKTHCFFTYSHLITGDKCEPRMQLVNTHFQEYQVAVTLCFVSVFWILMLLRGRTKRRGWAWWRRKAQVSFTATITRALLMCEWSQKGKNKYT